MNKFSSPFMAKSPLFEKPEWSEKRKERVRKRKRRKTLRKETREEAKMERIHAKF